MDFIFGTLATDELKVVHHRADRRGIQHAFHLQPRDPKPGEPVTLLVRLGAGLSADRVACYYTLDGSLPAGQKGVASRGQVVLLEKTSIEWDTVLWSYVSHWQAVLPPQPDSTLVRYRIGAWADGGDEVFADWPNVTATAEAAAQAFFDGKSLPTGFAPGDPGGTLFSYHVDTMGCPAWARQAVIYHIFVDRFYPGNGRDWLQKEDLEGFCGGTLWGVRDKLDYIKALGATCLWLSPTWVSPSHHGYDAIDYDHVEPRLGGDEAMHALVEAAHARGIRVLLDLACNHISNQHPIFQCALNEPNSPYRDWFSFDESAIGYRTFFGVASLPQVNLKNADARAWMIGIACKWLREFDVDGYRLDYANGPGPDFWTDFWLACKQVKPDSLHFGEVIDAPDVLQTYIGRLDGCLDFHLSDAFRRTYGWQSWTETDLERFLTNHQTYFPSDFLMPVFLDNHDMDRFLFIAGGDKEALRRAAALQMKLPAPPIILYGTEVGLSQAVSIRSGAGFHVSRTPMLWGNEQDQALLDYYKNLIRQRTLQQHSSSIS